MYSHILIPVLLNGRTDVKHAKSVAETLLAKGGKITVLHVVETIPPYLERHLTPAIHVETQTWAKKKLAEVAAEMGVNDTVLLDGPPGRNIVNWAQENSADCIVIDSHQPAFSDLFLGSVAAWVVRHATTSVHVLR
ncbi:MAG: universal stress protein [Pseudomonadota bacterium]